MADPPPPFQFLAQGYKVGRVDQCETALGAEIRLKDDKAKASKTAKAPAKGKEIVRRELKSVLTTGTIVDGALLTDDLANHCVAIKVRSLKFTSGWKALISILCRNTHQTLRQLLPSASVCSTQLLQSSNSRPSPMTRAEHKLRRSSDSSNRKSSFTRRATCPSQLCDC